LLDNLLLKLVSLALAGSLFLYVNQQQVSQQVVPAAVDLEVPEALVRTSAPAPSVVLQVQGRERSVLETLDRNLRYTVKLEARPGSQLVRLDMLEVDGLPAGVEVQSVAPATLEVVLEELVTRQASVEPSTRGKLPKGYRLADLVVEPDQVEVQGGSLSLQSLRVLPTRAVSLVGRESDFEEEVGLDFRGMPGIVAAQPSKVRVRGRVAAEPVEGTVEGLQVEVPPEWNLVARPATVQLRVRALRTVLATLGTGAVHLHITGAAPEAEVTATWPPMEGANPRLEVTVPKDIEVLGMVPSSVRLVEP
jgi:YbbR domain-containing protein